MHHGIHSGDAPNGHNAMLQERMLTCAIGLYAIVYPVGLIVCNPPAAKFCAVLGAAVGQNRYGVP